MNDTASTPAVNGLTLRALGTGIVLGILLTPSNVYSGLKIGWTFNMSIIALLIGFGFWRAMCSLLQLREWNMQESNINQTTASSAASIISGGLVAPIPAFTLLTGNELAVMPLIAWVFAVSFLGIWVAWYLRPALIVRSELKFPVGIATLETMNDIFSRGRDAMHRIMVLAGATILAAGVKWVDLFAWQIPRWAPSLRLERLTFNLDPSLLLLGFGGIIGIRTGLSLLGGAIIAWGIIAPWLLQAGHVSSTPGDASLFAPLVEWLLWPGVTLMVSCTLTGFIFRLVSLFPLQRQTGAANWNTATVTGASTAAVLLVLLQVTIFDIPLLMALLAFPMAVVLASVAARVVGETGIPPIGAIGKVSQLGFGIMAPGQVVTNLMTANAAGGTAGQCADLLNDFKVGNAINTSPGRQVIAQVFGVLTGSIIGALVYLVLIPEPATMLISEEWPAPAVATWKAVAETLSYGVSSIPSSARWSMLFAALAGTGLGLLESARFKRLHPYLPSGVAVGLSFVVPASTSMIMAAGAVLAWVVTTTRPEFARRFVIAAAAGLVAGESIMGVVASILDMSGLG